MSVTVKRHFTHFTSFTSSLSPVRAGGTWDGGKEVAWGLNAFFIIFCLHSFEFRKV